MNAYELADEIDSIVKDWLGQEKSGKLANMLRQQANELDKVVPQLVKANGLIENLRLRIAELEKDGKVCATCGGLVYDPVIKQTKPLSDEEIEKIENRIYCKTIQKGKTQGEYSMQLCRAIEERHGIK